MSNTILKNATSKAVATLISASQPFSLVQVLKTISVPTNVVIDMDLVEKYVTKMYFTDCMGDFSRSFVSDQAVYHPANASQASIKNVFRNEVEHKNVTDKNGTVKSDDSIVKPDSRGRIRIPVKYMNPVTAPGESASVSVANNKITISNKSTKNSKWYTSDRYNNLLFKAPLNANYKISVTGGKIVLVPVAVIV